MLDPSIITNGAINAQTQQANNMNMLGELGGAFGKLLLARQINDMNQMATPEEEKAFAQKHKLFAPQLMQQYNDNRQAEIKAFKDGLVFDANLNKTEAETDKLKSESGKIGAEKGKINAETTGLDIGNKEKRYGNIASVYSLMMHTGDINAGKSRLEALKANGLIDDAAYQSELANINALPTDRQSLQNASFATYRSMLDPKYNVTTPDNELDNQTSTNNNVRDNQGRVQVANINGEWGVKQAATTGEYGLKRETISQTHQDGRSQLQNKIEQQKLRMQQEQSQLVTGTDGKAYVFYPNRPKNKFEPYYGKDGNQMVGEAEKMGATGKNSPQQDIKRAQNVLSLTQQAEQILSSGKATGSGIGSLLDTGASWFGVSTEGAQGTAQLSTIAGQLVSNMPRMEGPQSDKDVAMYKQMAGDLSNASLPVATRMAALRQLQALNEKYLNNGTGGYPAASAPPADIAAPSTQQSLAARDKYFTGK